MFKKFFVIAVMLLGVKANILGQNRPEGSFPMMEKKQALVNRLLEGQRPTNEVFTYGTNTSSDGYIHLGYFFNQWGVYGGVHYKDNNVVSPESGTVSNSMRFGVMKNLQPNKWIAGLGLQPSPSGTKPHGFVGFNPLKSKDMKLWLIGNVTGSVFSYGAGLSYKIK